MDGPDLSRLLDGASSEKPSRDVLDGIVRRRRRIQTRHARTAATLGIVIALAGAGVGIGLSRHVGTTMAALPKRPSQMPPTMSNQTTLRVPSPAGLSGAPEGLGWVNTGSGAASASNVSSPLVEATSGSQSAGQLRVMNASFASGASLCSIWNCSLYSPYGSIGNVRLHRQFVRTRDGVTIRAFTAAWVEAPLELVPTASGSTGPATGSSVSTLPMRAVPARCALTRALVVEVSDAGAVGVVTVPLGPSLALPVDVLSDQVVGVAEQSPIVVVVAHVTARTAAVRADFKGGKDEMPVVDRWAVLVHKLTAAKSGGTGSQGSATPGQATVYALSGAGTVLEQAHLPGSGALAMAVAACSGAVHKVPSSSASGSDGSTGSGSTGSPSPRAPAASTKPIGG